MAVLSGFHLEGEATLGRWESLWLVGFWSRGSNTLTSPLRTFSVEDELLFGWGLCCIVEELGGEVGKR
jgi:hypothetical protein